MCEGVGHEAVTVPDDDGVAGKKVDGVRGRRGSRRVREVQAVSETHQANGRGGEGGRTVALGDGHCGVGVRQKEGNFF